MKKIGSQNRETLLESGMTLERRLSKSEVILKDADGKMELWMKSDDHSGYVIEIDGKGYEFISSNV